MKNKHIVIILIILTLINISCVYISYMDKPLYLRYLNNTNTWSDCWIEDGKILDERRDDCYNCEDYALDYIENVKDHYELFEVKAMNDDEQFGHALVRVCLYVDPTGNKVLSMEDLKEYDRLIYDEY